MKTLNRVAAAAGLLLSLSSIVYAQAPPPAKPMPPKSPMASKMSMTHRKGGYVHATTYTNKAGKTVHRKGYYRHATKPMMAKPMMKKAM